MREERRKGIKKIGGWWRSVVIYIQTKYIFKYILYIYCKESVVLFNTVEKVEMDMREYFYSFRFFF